MSEVSFQVQDKLTANFVGLWPGAEIVPIERNTQFTGSKFRVVKGYLPPFENISVTDIKYGHYKGNENERTQNICLTKCEGLKFMAISLGGTFGSRDGAKKLLSMENFVLTPKGGDVSEWSRTTGLRTVNWYVLPPNRFSENAIVYSIRTWKESENTENVVSVNEMLSVTDVPTGSEEPMDFYRLKECTMTQICDMTMYAIFNNVNIEYVEQFIWYAVCNNLSKYYENLVILLYQQGIRWRHGALMAIFARSNPAITKEFVSYLAEDMMNVDNEEDAFLDLFVDDIAKGSKVGFGAKKLDWIIEKEIRDISDLFRDPWIYYYPKRSLALDSLHDPVETPAFKSVRLVSLNLSHGMISSMVGCVEVEIDGKIIKVTLNTDDIIEPGVVLRSAEHGSDDLSDEIKDRARDIVKDRLVNGPGLVFKHTPEQIDSSLRKKMIMMPPLGGSSIINQDCSRKNFPNLPYIESTVDIFEDDSALTKKNIFKNRYIKGMRSDAYSVIAEYFQGIDPVVMSRVIAVGRNYSHHFEMNSMPSSVDIAAFQVLVAISSVVPSALKYNGIKFTVLNGAIYWDICERFMRMRPVDGHQWNLSNRLRTYVLRPYQEKAVNLLVNSVNNVDIVWLPPGAGKTLIVMEYFRRMSGKSAATNYFVWTTVPEAITNLKEQLVDCGLRYNEVSFNKGGNSTFKEFSINIIPHDHLIKIDMMVLDNVLTNSTLVIDEFHKCMGKSLRSDIAHLLTKTAMRTILMTGTIVKDLKTPGELVRYLESGVRFPVTTHNYFVALGKVVTERVPSASIISCKEIECNEDALERMVNDTRDVVKKRQLGVFICVETSSIQNKVAELLRDLRVFKIGEEKPSWGPDYMPIKNENGEIIPGAIDDMGAPHVVITTKTHVAGYEMNRYTIMFMLLFKSNDATRRQAFGRIDRQTNIAKEIEYYIYYNASDAKMMENYSNVGDFADSLNDLQSGEGGRKYNKAEQEEHMRNAREKADEAKRERGRFERENRNSRHGPIIEAHILLGLDPKTRPSKSELSKAFRAIAIKFHPDKFMDNDSMRIAAQENMVKINNANDLLKAHYDY